MKKIKMLVLTIAVVLGSLTTASTQQILEITGGVGLQEKRLRVDVNDQSLLYLPVYGSFAIAEIEARYSYISLQGRAGYSFATFGNKEIVAIENMKSLQLMININLVSWENDYNIFIGAGIHNDHGRVDNLLDEKGPQDIGTLAYVLQAGASFSVGEYVALSGHIGGGRYYNDSSIDLNAAGSQNDIISLYMGIGLSYMWP